MCCCNGNPMLRELSINLSQTIGCVRSLKIDDIHSRSVRLGLGLLNGCLRESGLKMSRGGSYPEVAFSFIEQAVWSPTCKAVCAVRRAGGDGDDA